MTTSVDDLIARLNGMHALAADSCEPEYTIALSEAASALHSQALQLERMRERLVTRDAEALTVIQSQAATIERMRKALEWAMPLAEIALEDHRQRRLLAGHTFGAHSVGLYDSEVEELKTHRAALAGQPAVSDQSAAIERMRKALEPIRNARISSSTYGDAVTSVMVGDEVGLDEMESCSITIGDIRQIRAALAGAEEK